MLLACTNSTHQISTQGLVCEKRMQALRMTIRNMHDCLETITSTIPHDSQAKATTLMRSAHLFSYISRFYSLTTGKGDNSLS